MKVSREVWDVLVSLHSAGKLSCLTDEEMNRIYRRDRVTPTQLAKIRKAVRGL